MNNGDMPASAQNGLIDPDGQYGSSKDMGGSGLTKREHFAGLAMQGVLADSKIMDAARIDDDIVTEHFVAGLAVEYADALLAALEES